MCTTMAMPTRLLESVAFFCLPPVPGNELPGRELGLNPPPLGNGSCPSLTSPSPRRAGRTFPHPYASSSCPAKRLERVFHLCCPSYFFPFSFFDSPIRLSSSPFCWNCLSVLLMISCHTGTQKILVEMKEWSPDNEVLIIEKPHMCAHVHTQATHTDTCTERERERERENSSWLQLGFAFCERPLLFERVGYRVWGTSKAILCTTVILTGTVIPSRISQTSQSRNIS